MSNAGDLNASGFGKSIVKVISQPKRQAWVISKYKANQKDSQYYTIWEKVKEIQHLGCIDSRNDK